MNPIFNKIPFLIALIGCALSPVLRAEVSDQHLPPAALPEFKTPAQLAKWKADVTAKSIATESAQAKVASSTPGAFYTGKPYIAESGTYSYKYREYNPEMARWTTVDPSGFPDGANNRLYSRNSSLIYVDPDGKNPVLILVGVVIISAALYQSAEYVSDAFKNADLNAQYTTAYQNAICAGNGDLAQQLYKDSQSATSSALVDAAKTALSAPGTLSSGPASIPESYEEATLVNGWYYIDIYATE